jgi:hypothetical protein
MQRFFNSVAGFGHMARRRSSTHSTEYRRELFSTTSTRKRRVLILPRFIKEEAEKRIHRGSRQDHAYDVIKYWADLEAKGHLAKKETALNADFLFAIFEDALGYRRHTTSPDAFELEREFTVSGCGTADGALGRFVPGQPLSPVAVIELKPANTDLDRDRSTGRTPVQQCWDYLNALPSCTWGIVSNFVTFRLYHRDKTPLVYEEFRLRDLTDFAVFQRFYCLFEVPGLLGAAYDPTPRALRLSSFPGGLP